MPSQPTTEPDLQGAAKRRFVRVIEERDHGLVAFEFAIGWPELSVDLLLPAAAFAEFCATQRVELLDPHDPS